MKLKSFFILGLIGSIALYSCEKNETVLDNKISSSSLEQCLINNPKNKPIVELTQIISSSLNEKSVRTFLKNEAIKQFDGDFDILLSKALNEKLETSKGGKKLSFKEIIINKMNEGKKTSQKNEVDFSNLLDSIIKAYPLLQIAIPEVFDSSTVQWDDLNYTPLTAVLPIDYDEDTENILAYDVNGNTTVLSTNEVPNKPVIVISQNESLIAVPKKINKNSTKVTPYYETDDYYYYLSEDHETPIDIGDIEEVGDDEIITTPSPSQDGSRDYLTGKDYLNKAKFVSKTTWRQVESWPSGRPEFKVIISYAEIINGTHTVKTITKVLPKNGWVSRYLVYNQIRTKNLDLPIIKWIKANFGSSMKYTWIEQDPSESQATLNIGYTTKFENGDQLTTTVSVKIGEKDDEAGEDVVDYNDSTSGEGSEYNTGIVRFWVNQQ